MLRTALLLAALSTSLLAQSPVPGVTLANTEQRTLTSTAISQRYDLLVSLPEGYATSGKAYPVLYVLDGWHFPLLAFLQNNIRVSERMPPVIIVNISHGAVDAQTLRTRDFTPKPMAGRPGSGGGAAFLAFLEGDIIPFVERTYRTIPTDRALLGHSLGGLFALWAMEQRPMLFQRIVAASPARLSLNRELFTGFDRLKASGASVRLDLSVGDEPGKEDIVEFARALGNAKLPNVTHRMTEFPAENHNSVRFASFPAGLYWVYRPSVGVR